MAAYDIQEGKMTLNHFKPTMQQPQSAADYIKTNLEVLSKDIHPMDQIELHKKPKKWYSPPWPTKHYYLTNCKIHYIILLPNQNWKNLLLWLRITRIKSLEEIITELGHDPKDPKDIQELIRKEEDITALKKQLKLPITMHPQTTKVAQQKAEDDMMGLLMRMNGRLAETQKALEESLQGKQGVLASQPSQTAPIVTTAPSTVTTAVPPTDLASTTPSTTSTTAATTTVPDTNMSMEKMMEETNAL